MPEFRIRVPKLKEGQRILAAAQRSVAGASSAAVRGTQAVGGQVVSRVGDVSSGAVRGAQAVGGQVIDRVGDLEAPHINLLDARRLVRDTNDRLEEASALLQNEHDETALQMQRLGEAELEAYDGPIRDFVALFERMKNVDLTDLKFEDAPEFARSFEVDVRDVDFSAVDLLKTMAAGGAAGAVAGMTAFAAVGTLATASTGTAIGTLSGAAATNATLAWLGGGAIASGGGGMALGTVVLGGVVALPVLAIGGLVVHHKGRQALAEAKQDSAKADVAIQEIEMARTVAHGIRLRARQITALVGQLATLSRRRNDVLRHLVDRNDDYSAYDDHDRHAVMLAASVAKTLRTVMDVPVIDNEGTLTRASRQAVEAAEQFLAESGHVSA